MSCDQCLLKFNNGDRKPFVLIPCCHTFCLSCLNQSTTAECFSCQSQFSKKTLNQTLLDIVENNPSNYEFSYLPTSSSATSKQLAKLKADCNEITSKYDRLNIATKYSKTFTINNKILDKCSDEFRNQTEKLVKQVEEEYQRIYFSINKTKNKFDDLNQPLEQSQIKNLEKNLKEFGESCESALDKFSRMKIEILEKPIKDPIDEFLIKSKNYFNDSNYEESLKNINKVLSLKEFCADDLILKGAICRRMERFREAIDSFEEVLKKDSKNIEALFYKGLTLVNIGRNDEAVNIFNQVNNLNTKPESLRDNLLKARTLSELRKSTDAQVYFDKCIKISPNNWNVYFHKAVDKLRLSHDYEACELFKKTIDLNPKLDVAYASLGTTFNKMGASEKKAALENLSKAIELNRHNYMAQTYRIITLAEENNIQDTKTAICNLPVTDSNNYTRYSDLLDRLSGSNHKDMAKYLFIRVSRDILNDMRNVQYKILSRHFDCAVKIDKNSFDIARNNLEKLPEILKNYIGSNQ